MVANIQLLQGKIIDDLDRHPKNFTKLMEELALEILEDQEVETNIERSTG
jgi:hypothetical protein